MASVGTVDIPIKPDTTKLVEVLRVVAKHAQSCADELEAISTRRGPTDHIDE